MTSEFVRYDLIQSLQSRELIGGSGGDDTTPPLITNFVPTSGSSITATTTISFDVTDETELAYHAVFAVYTASGLYDVIWDGDAFSQTYVNSSRSSIANGFAYQIRRKSGWQESPTIRVVALDTSGNRG